MLLLIISLFTMYGLFSCVNNENAKFDESLLMKQHHQNILQIKHFIREAQHKFHEQKSVLSVRVGDYGHQSTRDDELLDHSITNWWWDNTSSIDQLSLKTQQSFFLPLIRSRPSFPFSITPYTTELNNQHLKWDEIFPNQNDYTRSSKHRFRTGLKVSSKNEPSLPQLPSKTLLQRPKDQIPSSFFQNFSEPLLPNTTSSSPNTSLRDHSAQGFGLTLSVITPNEQYKKTWLREITTYTPVERWFKTLATQSGRTPSFDYTTPAKGAPQLGLTPTKASEAQALVSTKQLKNDSKDQPPLILRQGLPLSDTPTEVDVSGYLIASTATAKTAQFFIEDVGTATEKVEEKTKMIDKIPVTVPNDGMMMMTSTTRDVQWYREQIPWTPTTSSRKSRRFQSIARKRKHHYYSQKRQKPRQTFQRHRYEYRHHEYSNEDIYQSQQQKVEYPMLRRMKETTEDQKRFRFNTPKHSNRGIEKEARLSENRKHREPTPLPNAVVEFFSENDDTDDEKLIKLIERQDDSRHESTNKVYFYQHVKECLKQAESKKKAKRLKLKAELLRKIVEGSSYSDEEASLKKNLIQALQYENKDFEHKPTFLRT